MAGHQGRLRETLHELHHRIEAKERARISQGQMAARLGISPRTYVEYLRGTNAPLGMRVILDLLGMLDDRDVGVVVGDWVRARRRGARDRRREVQHV